MDGCDIVSAIVQMALLFCSVRLEVGSPIILLAFLVM